MKSLKKKIILPVILVASIGLLSLALMAYTFSKEIIINHVETITEEKVEKLVVNAEFYLKYKVKGGLVSDLVSSANLAFNPDPTPKGQIQYLNTVTEAPITSIPIFTRIVSPSSTLVIDGSQIIIPPGESLVVYLGGILPIEPDSTKVAFGWWEEKIYNCCKCYYYSKNYRD